MNQQPGENTKRHRAGRGRGGRLPQERKHPISIPNHVKYMPIQMNGFVGLVPHTVLDAIAETSCLMVIQCLEPLEIFTGIETANRYVVHDMFLRPLLYCNENSGFLARQCCGNGRSFVMQMKDIYGAPFMDARRTAPCFCEADHLATRFMGTSIGVMSREFCSEQFQMLASGCNMPLSIVSPGCLNIACQGTNVFPFVTPYGQKLGEIVRLFPGYLQEIFTDADSYLVSFPYNMPPILKLLLISAVFLIEFTYFEKDS